MAGQRPASGFENCGTIGLLLWPISHLRFRLDAKSIHDAVAVVEIPNRLYGVENGLIVETSGPYLSTSPRRKHIGCVVILTAKSSNALVAGSRSTRLWSA